MAGYILTMLGDRMEMGHSIEGRVPFPRSSSWSELIASQPVNQKMRGMTEKYVLREAVKDVITDTVYRRQKHPFLSPPATLNPDDTFQRFCAGHAARRDAAVHAVLRSEGGSRPPGSVAADGCGSAHGQRPDPHAHGESMCSAGEVRLICHDAWAEQREELGATAD